MSIELFSVLPKSTDVNFEVLKCITDVDISENFDSAIYTKKYQLRKIANNHAGNDTWIEVTGYEKDECELISVQSDNGDIPKTKNVENNKKLAFLIDFGKQLQIGIEIDFCIKFKRPIKNKKIEGGIFFKRNLIFFENILSNLCYRFQFNMKFKRKRCKIVNNIPEYYKADNSKYSFRKDILHPNEIYTVGVLVDSGLLGKYSSKIISGLFLMVTGGFVSLFITEIYNFIIK